MFLLLEDGGDHEDEWFGAPKVECELFDVLQLWFKDVEGWFSGYYYVPRVFSGYPCVAAYLAHHKMLI